MEIKLPVDNQVRLEAIDPRCSFVISAPAGSGKTGLLTFRVLKLLCVVNHPEDILAITFTRKAAAEMHERIFSCLTKAAQELSEDKFNCLSDYDQNLLNCSKQVLKRSTDLNWDILSNPSRLNISTIDGFCKSICNQLPFFSAIGSSTSVLEDPSSEYELVTKRWLLDELKQQENEDIQRLIEHFSGNIERLVSLFSELLGVRDQWLPLLSFNQESSVLQQYFEQTLSEWVYQSIDQVLPYLKPYEGELFHYLDYAKNNISEAKDPSLIEALTEYSSLPNWEEGAESFWRNLASFCLTKDKTYKKRVDKNLGFPTFKNKEENQRAKEVKASLLRMFSDLAESGLSSEMLANMLILPDTQYADDSWRILEALMALLPKLAAHLKLRFTELSKADFTEFSLGAVRALDADMGDIDLLQRLDYSVQHILIDEFQDTSQTQLELLKSLTKEWQPGDGKTLFLVGDGMQSCYGFRNANVGIFLSMRHKGLTNIDLQSRDLSVNFRSDACIVDWVNQAFSSSFPDQDDINSGAVQYISSSSFNGNNDASYVKCNAFEKGTEDEARYLVKEVIALRAEKPQESIAVLARSRNHLYKVIKAFEEHGVDYLATDFDPLFSKQHISDIHCIAQFLYNTGDKLAYLSLLRSPFCGLNHADLFAFFNLQHDEHIESDQDAVAFASMTRLTEQVLSKRVLSQAGHSRLNRMQQVLKPMLDAVNRRSFSECVEICWLKLGGPECLESDAELNDIEVYLDLLNRHEVASCIESWPKLETALASEFATPNSMTDNPVQIMTMHKSKGLEFDTVFLPSLDKRKRSDDSNVLYWLEKLDENLETQFILSPITAKNTENPNQITAYIKSKISEKSNYEDLRIFYVACTRAKKRLYLSANFDFEHSGEIKQAEKSAFISKIWPSIESEIHIHKSIPAQKEISFSAKQEATIKTLPLDWQFHYDASLENTPVNTFDNTDFDFYQRWQEDNLIGRAKGIAVHSLLQLAAVKGLHTLIDLPSNHIKGFIDTKLKDQGLNNTDREISTEEILKLFNAICTDTTLQWILADAYPHTASEWSLWDTLNGQTREHIIDRSFIDGDTRWVIDYKSSIPNEDQTIEQFVEEQKKLHLDQLVRYRNVISSFDKNSEAHYEAKQIKLGLYFPFLSRFVHCNELDLSY